MFTNVEGEWDEVMALVKACAMKLAEHAPRVEVVIKIDYRPAAADQMHAKVESLERWLQQPA
jgi:uncharacterized protein YqgV (UPF0045/DUF77 family)